MSGPRASSQGGSGAAEDKLGMPSTLSVTSGQAAKEQPSRRFFVSPPNAENPALFDQPASPALHEAFNGRAGRAPVCMFMCC